ncbi:hypothetical protein D3C73_185590 [compost metagenome]
MVWVILLVITGKERNDLLRKYKKQELIDSFWSFYEKNGRYPYGKEMEHPSIEVYKRVFGGWKDFLREIDILGENGWYKCDEKILMDHYEYQSKEYISNKLMIKRSWNMIKNKAASMGIERNKSLVRRIYSDDFLISELRRYYIEYGTSPTEQGFRSNSNYPSTKPYIKRFESWNKSLEVAGLDINCYMTHSKEMIMNCIKDFYKIHKRSPYYNEIPFSKGLIRNYWENWQEALLECGLKPNKQIIVLHSKEDGIVFLQELAMQLGRVPTTGDIIETNGIYRNWFLREFGSFTNALLESKIISNQDIVYASELLEISISTLRDLYIKLKRVPTAEEYDSYIRINNIKAISRRNLSDRLGLTYLEICEKYLDIIDEHLLGRFCVNREGKICRSSKELLISNFLLTNGLTLSYEPLYKEAIDDFAWNFRFDWRFKFNGNIYYIEYFGLYSEQNRGELFDSYREKTKLKINICKDNKINLISLFPSDLDDNLRGVRDKFALHNIHLSNNGVCDLQGKEVIISE